MKATSLSFFLLVVFLQMTVMAKDKCIKGNCVNGRGFLVYTEGSKYEGEWKEGLRHGYGVIKSADNVILKKGFYFRNIYVEEEKPEKYFWRNGLLLSQKHGQKLFIETEKRNSFKKSTNCF